MRTEKSESLGRYESKVKFDIVTPWMIAHSALLYSSLQGLLWHCVRSELSVIGSHTERLFAQPEMAKEFFGILKHRFHGHGIFPPLLVETAGGACDIDRASRSVQMHSQIANIFTAMERSSNTSNAFRHLASIILYPQLHCCAKRFSEFLLSIFFRSRPRVPHERSPEHTS